LGLALALAVAGAAPARAFDLLVFLGLREEPSPPAAPGKAAFTLDVTVQGGDGDIERAMRDASTLAKLRLEPPPDAESLVRIAESDLVRLTDTLWGLGYYNGGAWFEIAGAELRLGRPTAPAVRAASALQGRAQIPVRIVAAPGPLFSLRRFTVLDRATGRPYAPQVLPERVVKFEPGAAGRAADVIAAEARIVDHFRAMGHPFARVVSRKPVVDHPALAYEVTLTVDPGPVAGIGPVAVSGLTSVDPAPVRSFIYTQPGDPYSPAAVEGIRRSLSKVEILGGVRIREAETLDANGNLPLFVELTERKPRAIGASAAYSTVDGPELRAYWAHRNLFGGAETLRLEGSLFYATPSAGSDNRSLRDFSRDDLGGRFSASFVKPGLGGTPNDLLGSGLVERNRTLGYTVRRLGTEFSLRHRFSDNASVQAGARFERGQTSDILGQIDYTLVGFPISGTWDTTDNALDPTRGFRVKGSVTPYPAALGSTVDMTILSASGSAYYAIDEDARVILAARLGLGSVVGPSLADIPSNYRFYAGGGNSVRGYRYQSLSPRIGRTPIGGRSLLEASFEARIKITDTIGIVPFVDTGMAFEDEFPDFNRQLQTAVGLGLRYYTPIGPVRLDVAAPINRRPGDRPVALYISIGQAF
jgi:translocation and assembly module TamA